MSENPFGVVIVILEVQIGDKRLAAQQVVDRQLLDAMPDIMESVKADLRTALGLEILKHFPPTLRVTR